MADSKFGNGMLAFACIAACTAGGRDGGGFPGYPSGPSGGKNDAIEDSGSSEAGDEETSDDDSQDDDHDSADDTTGALDDGDSGHADPSTTSAGEDDGPATTGVDPTGAPGPGQPAMGLWAQCTMDAYDNCTFAAPVCISGEFDNGVEDGFCSTDICSNPAVDCQPVPLDSDATPICVEARDPMNQPVFLCALGCAQGETCPAGMNCIEGISFGEDLPIYSFCV